MRRRIIGICICVYFGLCIAWSINPQKYKQKETNDTVRSRVHLLHVDSMFFDDRVSKTAQFLVGNVQFEHEGIYMYCDSAYFYQESNSFKAFGRVKMVQGDTLSLNSDYAFYDGDNQMAEARHNVVLRHRKTKLYTDSLVAKVVPPELESFNFDRFEGKSLDLRDVFDRAEMMPMMAERRCIVVENA